MLESLFGCDPFFRIVDEYLFEQVEELPVKLVVWLDGVLIAVSKIASSKHVVGGTNLELLHGSYIFFGSFGSIGVGIIELLFAAFEISKRTSQFLISVSKVAHSLRGRIFGRCPSFLCKHSMDEWLIQLGADYRFHHSQVL